jgi:tRNA modification GTPase
MSVATIVSQSTPSGFSAIGVIRLSGNMATKIAAKLSNKKSVLKHKKATVRPVFIKKRLVDEAVFTAFLSPKSYTGEDVVEISCHGNIHVCEAIITETVRLGARIAEPGEYTKRAFLNGKLNLLQAESVSLLISARSIEAVKQQTKNLSGGITEKIVKIKETLLTILSFLEYELDVSEGPFLEKESIKFIKENLKACLKKAISMTETFNRGSALSNGVKVAFVGKPNVGKSTLVNKILGVEKSITSNAPGTTRDVVSTETSLGGVPVTLIDTAGIHSAKNQIEKEGIKRSFEEIKTANLVVSVFCPESETVDIKDFRNQICVYNKRDITPYKGKKENVFSISATKGTGVSDLVQHIEKRIGGSRTDAAESLLTTIRQKEAMLEVSSCLSRATSLFISDDQTIELPAQEIKSAIENIDLFTGKTTTNDILDRVFSTFCVGK